jgi:RNA polymerase sigma-70 factor, ECF subfamily
MPDSGSFDGSSSPAEFVRLFSRDQGRLFRYVVALVPNLQDAEDVLSETTVTLWREFGHFEQGTNFFAWARRIAHFRAQEFYRARSRRLPDEVLEALAAETEKREMEVDPRLLYLAECRERLPASDHDLLQRRYVENVPVQDMARQLGRPVNSVSKSLGRIRRMLLECVSRKIAARVECEKWPNPL